MKKAIKRVKREVFYNAGISYRAPKLAGDVHRWKNYLAYGD